MKRLLLIAFSFFSSALLAQSFEVIGIQENYKGIIGENIKAPLRLKNISDKTIVLVIRKVTAQIGSTQKNYFCLDGNCQDQRLEEFLIRIEPGQTVTNFQIQLESGIVSSESVVKYSIHNKYQPTEATEVELNFLTEEKPEKQSIYTSRFMTLHDVYPNPVTDHAFVDYKILNDQIKARIVIHNILGNVIGEYDLPLGENKIKMRTEDLNAGIYFYTLYINNDGVMTRKLIVKN